VRLLALNLNHRTLPARIDPSLVSAFEVLSPDVLVFNEYVDIGVARELRAMLTSAGYVHQAVSDIVEYRRGRWHNQVLIASKDAIEDPSTPQDGPDCLCTTNTLSVTTFGTRVTGVRVPAYKSASEWYSYWEWASKALEGDVAIGDFNADPARHRKWDRVLAKLESLGNWSRPGIEGEWSYRGHNGSSSRVDHVLVRNGIRVSSARYVPEPFVPTHTDHAALIVDISR